MKDLKKRTGKIGYAAAATTFVALAVGSADAASFTIANDGQARCSVVVSATADPNVTAAARALTNYLERISGGKFALTTGSGATGIAVGLLSDFPGLGLGRPFDPAPPGEPCEQYLLRSHAGGLYLIGATDRAVKYAVWDLLYRFGHRQFFPTATWEVVPSSSTLTIDVDVTNKPDWYERWLYADWCTWPENLLRWRIWWERNRIQDVGEAQATGECVDTSQGGPPLEAAFPKEFADHPEYFALQPDGSRYHGKFCLSNPGLRALGVKWAVNYLTAHPNALSISLSPTDGAGYCQCAACKALGSVTDQEMTLANQVADAVAARFPGKGVAILAYDAYTAPPAGRVASNVVVQINPTYNPSGLSMTELLDGWSKKGAKPGIYDIVDFIVGSAEMPGYGNTARDTAAFTGGINSYHDHGARYYCAEASEGWGPFGLAYYLASRVLWDRSADVAALRSDFFDKCFNDPANPAVKQAMSDFYNDYIDGATMIPTPDAVAHMYDLLNAARRSTQNPAIRARINDLILYTRYLELYRDFCNVYGDSHATPQQKTDALAAVCTFLYHTRDTMMVHSFALYDYWTTSLYAALVPANCKSSIPADKNPWMTAGKGPVTDDEVSRILEGGLSHNPVVYPRRPSLISEYTFDDTIKNAVKGAPDGVLVKGGATYVSGKCGKALAFNGPNDYVRLAANALPLGPTGPKSPMTGSLAFWIKTTATDIQALCYNAVNAANRGCFRVGLNEMETCLSIHHDKSERAVALYDLRVYGDSGSTLAAGTNLDLVSSSALTGGVTFAPSSGWTGWADAKYMVDDNPPEFHQYQALYSQADLAGKTVTLTWGQTITFGAFGFSTSNSTAYFDANMHFRVWGATDGATFKNLLLDVNGGMSPEPAIRCWNLSAPFTGNALKFEIVSAKAAMIFHIFAYASAPGVIFTNRANVNLLNARGVTVKATHVAAANSPDDLRGFTNEYGGGGGWFSDFWYDGSKEKFTIDFGQVRNIKTIRTYSVWKGNMLAMTVETSDDGSTWTIRPNTPSGSGTTYKFVLNDAVDARYLRITGEAYQYDGGVPAQPGSLYLVASASNREAYFVMGLPAGAATNLWRDGNWHQVVLVWSATRGLPTWSGAGHCYIDGVKQTVIANSSDVRPADTFPASWTYGAQIGGVYWNGSHAFTGSLGDYALWDAQLNDAQVKALYNLGNDSALNYNAKNVQTLFDVFHDHKPRTTGDGKTWRYAAGLSGNPGDVRDHNTVILDGSGNGVTLNSP